jgi:hypothetical protein
MVERIRQSKIFGLLAAICFELHARFVGLVQDDETPDEEIAAASHGPQAIDMPRIAYIQAVGVSVTVGMAHLTAS